MRAGRQRVTWINWTCCNELWSCSSYVRNWRPSRPKSMGPSNNEPIKSKWLLTDGDLCSWQLIRFLWFLSTVTLHQKGNGDPSGRQKTRFGHTPRAQLVSETDLLLKLLGLSCSLSRGSRGQICFLYDKHGSLVPGLSQPDIDNQSFCRIRLVLLYQSLECTVFMVVPTIEY